MSNRPKYRMCVMHIKLNALTLLALHEKKNLLFSGLGGSANRCLANTVEVGYNTSKLSAQPYQE